MEINQIEHIEDFLDGRISREELEGKLTEEQLQSLEADIEWVKNSRMAIEMAGLREQLEEALPKPQQGAKVRRLGGFRPWMAIAAAIALFALIYFASKPKNPQLDLYAQYEYVDPGLPVLMSQSEDYLFLDAMTYYGEGNYEVAAEKLEAIQDQYVGNDSLTFYLGASHLYQGNADKAREKLEKIASMEGSEFKERAEWMLALTALQAGNLEAVEAYLEVVLKAEGHRFAEQAKNLQLDIKAKAGEK